MDLEWIYPMERPLTDELMLELFFAVILPALGAAILFNLGSSTGGTDIAAMILKKYTGLDVGRALLYSDVLIAASALFVFDITAGPVLAVGSGPQISAGRQCDRILESPKSFYHRHLSSRDRLRLHH